MHLSDQSESRTLSKSLLETISTSLNIEKGCAFRKVKTNTANHFECHNIIKGDQNDQISQNITSLLVSLEGAHDRKDKVSGLTD